jgi:predicted ATPase
VQQAYGRAETLCDRLGERADIFPALWGQWLFRWGRSEMDAAWRLGNRLLALAARSGSAALQLQAHHAMWATTFGRGEFAQTRAHAAAGLAIYDASVHQAMASSYGNHDAALCARYFSALALAIEGDERRTRALIESMLATARGLDDPFSLALVLFFSSAALQILGDVKLAAARAEECVQMAAEHALALPKSWSSGVMGWSLVQNGERVRGLAMLEEALASLQATQSKHFVSYLLGLLGDARFKADLHAEALEAVEQALALSRNGERFYSAELHRLQGVLCAHPTFGRHGEAAVSFKNAIAIARAQGAETFERKARKNLETLEAG